MPRGLLISLATIPLLLILAWKLLHPPAAPTPPDPALEAVALNNLIDINTATADELAILPGLGKISAERVIEYRKKHGPFRSIDDLHNVPGIGEIVLSHLRPHAVAGATK